MIADVRYVDVTLGIESKRVGLVELRIGSCATIAGKPFLAGSSQFAGAAALLNRQIRLKNRRLWSEKNRS